jgi:hypothetical protein
VEQHERCGDENAYKRHAHAEYSNVDGPLLTVRPILEPVTGRPASAFSCGYAEFIAQVDIAALEVIKGSLPRPQLHTVKAWAVPRRGALQAAWEACAAGRNPGRIE